MMIDRILHRSHGGIVCAHTRGIQHGEEQGKGEEQRSWVRTSRQHDMPGAFFAILVMQLASVFTNMRLTHYAWLTLMVHKVISQCPWRMVQRWSKCWFITGTISTNRPWNSLWTKPLRSGKPGNGIPIRWFQGILNHCDSTLPCYRSHQPQTGPFANFEERNWTSKDTNCYLGGCSNLKFPVGCRCCYPWNMFTTWRI